MIEFKNINLKRKDNKRIGCDICKEDCATEKFIGYCNNVFWICENCYDKLVFTSDKIRIEQIKKRKN